MTDESSLALTLSASGKESVFTRLTGKDSVPRIWEYKGRTYCDNLFKLHDQEGIPLSFSIGECMKRGWIPCLNQFVSDAIRSGRSKERAQAMVREAEADNAPGAEGATT